MAGEINGTFAVLHDSVGEIVGQMEFTVTYSGTPIDISNKSAEDYITMLDGELAGKQLSIAGTIIYNEDASYAAMETAALSGTQGSYTFDFGPSAGSKQLSFTGVPTGFSESSPHGDKVSASVTFLSSGSFTQGVVA